MDLHYISEEISPAVTDLIHRFYQLYDTQKNDRVTVRTIHFKMLECILGELNITWDQIAQIMKNSVRVHPENVATLMQMSGDLETEALLSQTFIPNEKIARIVKQLATRYGDEMDELLAVDGLSGNLNNGPNYDYKHYIQNLRYPKDAANVHVEEDGKIKQLHISAVRALYKHLSGRVKQPIKHHVYALLKQIVKNVNGVELQDDEVFVGTHEPVCGGMGQECEKIYTQIMSENVIEELAKTLRFREKRHMNGDEEPIAKKRAIETN